MEARLKRLEDDVQRLRIDAAQATARLGGVETRLDGVATRLGGVETRLGGVESRLAGVEGKLDLLVTQVVGKIPSGMQMFGIFVGTLVAGVTILGGAIKAAQVLRLIPPA